MTSNTSSAPLATNISKPSPVIKPRSKPGSADSPPLRTAASSESVGSLRANTSAARRNVCSGVANWTSSKNPRAVGVVAGACVASSSSSESIQSFNNLYSADDELITAPPP